MKRLRRRSNVVAFAASLLGAGCCCFDETTPPTVHACQGHRHPQENHNGTIQYRTHHASNQRLVESKAHSAERQDAWANENVKLQESRSLKHPTLPRCATKARNGPAEVEASAREVDDWFAEKRARHGKRQLAEGQDEEEETTYVVPTFVHAIQASSEDFLIASPDDIQQTIDKLNQAFDSSSARANVTNPFFFELRDYTAHVNASWFFCLYGTRITREMNMQLHRGGTDALNIYLCDPQPENEFSGWSTLPQWLTKPTLITDTLLQLQPPDEGQVTPSSSTTASSSSRLENYDRREDGVVLAYNSLPNVGITSWQNTIVHEVGHFMGLYHTFENGCNPPGDGVSDTPAVATPSYQCPHEPGSGWSVTVEVKNSCPDDLPGVDPGADQTANWMDYTHYSNCGSAHFTPGQLHRMKAMYEFHRRQVLTEEQPEQGIFNDGTHHLTPNNNSTRAANPVGDPLVSNSTEGVEDDGEDQPAPDQPPTEQDPQPLPRPICLPKGHACHPLSGTFCCSFQTETGVAIGRCLNGRCGSRRKGLRSKFDLKLRHPRSVGDNNPSSSSSTTVILPAPFHDSRTSPQLSSAEESTYSRSSGRGSTNNDPAGRRRLRSRRRTLSGVKGRSR